MSARRAWIRTMVARQARELSSEERERRDTGLEIVIAALLGLAAVATAFAAYQAELRDGDALLAFNQATRTINEASQAYGGGDQQLAIDQSLFLEYGKAFAQNDRDQQNFLRLTLMRPELVKAVDWWVKERPQPSSPFVPENPHYSLQGHVLGDELSARTDRLFTEAKANDDAGDRYTLITVFLATSLFLYGIAAVMHRYPVKVGLISAGFAIFLVSVVLLAAV